MRRVLRMGETEGKVELVELVEERSPSVVVVGP